MSVRPLEDAPASDLALQYRRPAAAWTEALPVGNGRLGAMVFGGVGRERLQLNEETLWAGGPHDPVNPAAHQALPRVRALVAEGRYADAEALADAEVMAVPLKQPAYLCLGDLWIEATGADGAPLPEPGSAGVVGYRRSLDLDAAIARTAFALDGVGHQRRTVVSPRDQVIATHLAADRPAAVSVRVRVTSPLQRWQVVAEGDYELVLTGRGDDHAHVPGALDVVARVRVDAVGGTVRTDGDAVVVEGADEVTVLVVAATSYAGLDDVSGDPASITRAQLDAARGRSFAELEAGTAADHRALFRGFGLDLGPAPIGVTTDERIERAQHEPDPGLAALYLQYARYLLICSSRPGTQPANLQGIWNESTDPPWGSKYTVNINAEMNYWPAFATGLGACAEPLERLIREAAVTGARTASAMYGARGWVLHHNTDLWRSSAPIDGARFGLWPTGGAWLCTHLWERYVYEQDEDYLASVYPIMRDACLFFVDTLQTDAATGHLVTNPSVSPENVHPHGATVVAGPTMDAQILRDLFDQTSRAAVIVGEEDELIAELRRVRDALPPMQVGVQGQLQEWLQDWDGDAPEPDHRHTSHLYGLYPGEQISLHGEPALAAAARRTLELRGDESTGWATAWRIALWARLGDGEHAHTMLRLLLSPGLTYPNMLDAHPPFQIDGNFGGAAGMLEMLVQTDGDQVRLLPALPSAWPEGALTGLRLPGGLGLDLAWRDGAVDVVTLRAGAAARRTVSWPGESHDVDLEGGASVSLTGATPTA